MQPASYWMILCAAVLSHGFFLSVILLVLRKGDVRANRYLAAILSVFCVTTVQLAFHIAGLDEFVRPVRFVPTLLWMIFPPLVYFYVRLSAGEPVRWTLVSLIHLLPIALVACDMTFLHPTVHRLEAALSPGHPDYGGRMLYNLLYTVQAIVYFTRVAGYLRSSSIMVRALLVGFAADTLVGFVAASFQFIMQRSTPNSTELSTVIFAVLVYVFGYLAIRGKSGFFTPRIDSASESQSAASRNIIGNLTSIMESDKLYLDSRLRYSDVAVRLGISTRALSSALNGIGKTFNDFVNDYRVREAKDLMEIRTGYTLLGIAFSSGFNSKSSFNRIFKQVTGNTPSSYFNKHHSGELKEIESSM